MVVMVMMRLTHCYLSNTLLILPFIIILYILVIFNSKIERKM